MDKTQITAFLDYMIGERNVGGSPEDPLSTPHSPELRAFITARLGDHTPTSGYYLVPGKSGEWYGKGKEHAAALASLLREVSDAIDPPIETN